MTDTPTPASRSEIEEWERTAYMPYSVARIIAAWRAAESHAAQFEAQVRMMAGALDMARQFIASQYRDPTVAPEGEWLSREARPVHTAICDAITAPPAALALAEREVVEAAIVVAEECTWQADARLGAAVINLYAARAAKDEGVDVECPNCGTAVPPGCDGIFKDEPSCPFSEPAPAPASEGERRRVCSTRTEPYYCEWCALPRNHPVHAGDN